MLETVESIFRNDGEDGISEGLDEMGYDERPELLDEDFDFSDGEKQDRGQEKESGELFPLPQRIKTRVRLENNR